MSDKLEASAAKALNKLTTATEAVVAKLGTLAEKYGPEAIDAGLWVVRVNGLRDLAFSALWLGLSGVLLFWLAPKLWARATAYNEANPRDIWHVERRIPGVLLYVLGAFTGAIAAFCFFDVWTWVAIFEPKLWVAKKLLGL